MLQEATFIEFANDDGFQCQQCETTVLRCELAEVTRRDDEHHIRFTCLACGHVFWERIDLQPTDNDTERAVDGWVERPRKPPG